MSSKPVRFESLLEAVPDALVGMDQAGVIRFVNHQTELLFGYDRDDLVGRHIQTLVPHTLWQIYADHKEGYFADPRTRAMGVDLELCGRHVDGTDFPVNISLSPIDTGDILLSITAVYAVARQKKALENARHMTAIIASSDDAIVGLTLKGIITSWNPAAEKMFGYPGEKIIGKSVGLLTPKDRTGELYAALDKIGAGQHVDHFETIGVREDATVITVSLSVSPIRDEDVSIVGASTITRDVTRQSQTLEASRSLIESSLDSWVTISPAGRITDVSEATVKVTGVPARS